MRILAFLVKFICGALLLGAFALGVADPEISMLPPKFSWTLIVFSVPLFCLSLTDLALMISPARGLQIYKFRKFISTFLVKSSAYSVFIPAIALNIIYHFLDLEWKGEWSLAATVAFYPFVALGLWENHKLDFSETAREVRFPIDDHRSRFDGLPPLKEGLSQAITNTRRSRPGIKRAILRKYVIYFGLSLLFILLAPFTIFSNRLLLWIRNLFYEKVDEAAERVTRLRAPTLDEVIRSDQRNAVLLLRSFKDDPLEIQEQEMISNNTGRISFESILCSKADRWGPVIAIGDPNEEVPRIGAARAYFTNETWQTHALDLLRKSGLVILVIGETPAVEWELGKIFELGFWRKALLVVPPVPEAEYSDRLRRLRRSLEGITAGSSNLDLASDERILVITFDEHRRFIPISSPFLHYLSYHDALQQASKVIRWHTNPVH